MFFKIGVLKNFAIFTKKHLSWSLFLTTLQANVPATLLKRDSNTAVFLGVLRTPPVAASRAFTKWEQNYIAIRPF